MEQAAEGSVEQAIGSHTVVVAQVSRSKGSIPNTSQGWWLAEDNMGRKTWWISSYVLGLLCIYVLAETAVRFYRRDDGARPDPSIC